MGATTRSMLTAPSGTLSGASSEQIINFFLSSPVLILLSSDNQAVKFLNVNAKCRSQSQGFVCKAGNGNHETIKHVLVVR